MMYNRKRTGNQVQATVVSVDLQVLPFAYGIQVGDDLVQTEAERLAKQGYKFESMCGFAVLLMRWHSVTKPCIDVEPLYMLTTCWRPLLDACQWECTI